MSINDLGQKVMIGIHDWQSPEMLQEASVFELVLE